MKEQRRGKRSTRFNAEALLLKQRHSDPPNILSYTSRNVVERCFRTCAINDWTNEVRNLWLSISPNINMGISKHPEASSTLAYGLHLKIEAYAAFASSSTLLCKSPTNTILLCPGKGRS